MARLDIRESRPMALIGWLGEKVGRLKPNGYLVRRSPLSDVVELEALRTAALGKLAGWQVLRLVARDDRRLAIAELDALIARADSQASRLEVLHTQMAERQLAHTGS